MYWFKSYLITKSCKCKDIHECTFACPSDVITITLKVPGVDLTFIWTHTSWIESE